MSKYTTELRFICETLAGYDASQDYANVAEIIEKARPLIFSFTYPLYDSENKKQELETKIIRHYYTREICAETYGRWKMFLEDKMNLIMPYYNELYKSAALEFDPLNDVDMTTTRESKGTEATTDETTSTTNGTSNTDGWSKYSDTPQGGVSGLESDTYLTNATHATNNGNTTTTGTDKSTGARDKSDSGTEHVSGKSASKSYSELLKEYRETILNIDEMIISDLDDLFMGIW